MKIKTLNSLPGAGKTEAMIKKIINGNYQTVIWVAPTIKLITETAQRFESAGCSLPIKAITSETEDSVRDAIIDFKQNNDRYLLLLTQNGFTGSLSTLTGNDLVVFDEEIQIKTYNLTSEEAASQAIWHKHFTFKEFEGRSQVGYLTSTSLEMWKDELVNTGHIKEIKSLAARTETKIVYSSRKSQGKMYLDLFVLPNMDLIKQNKEVIFLGHNVEKAISSRLYEALDGVEYEDLNLEGSKNPWF